MYALLADGSTVQIRAAAAGDFAAVKAMHEAMSPDNAYLRFFSTSRTAAEREARRVTREPRADHAALLALYGAEVVGVASYEVVPSSGGKPRRSPSPSRTPCTTAASRRCCSNTWCRSRGRGGSSRSSRRRSARTSACCTSSPTPGCPRGAPAPKGVVTITIPLPADDTGKQLEDYLDTVALRERSANVASLRPVFDPKSVAVVGASRRRGTVGRSVLDNIRTCGYQGQLYAVNPNAQPDRRRPLLPRRGQPAGNP